LKCRDGGLGFGVEVIKHEHADLGAVLLYLNNQHIVAAAYSIDNDQLPQSTQASLFSVSLPRHSSSCSAYFTENQ